MRDVGESRVESHQPAPALEDERERGRLVRAVGGSVLAAFAVVSLVSVAIVAMVVGLGWWALSGGVYGCTPRDQRLGAALAELEVLDQRPPGATPKDGRYQGCDEDDGFAYAGQYYLPEGDPSSVVAFYRDAPARDGWRLEREDDDPVPDEGLVTSGSRLCFTKQVQGTTAYLSVWFPADYGESTREYGLEITASHDGEAWC